MIEAVFISDLHLHPEQPLITQRFFRFVEWAKKNVQSIYILGDFFHVWPGDDALNPWSLSIAESLHSLAEERTVYFMVGNRDFLLGKEFAKIAKVSYLPDPFLIQLGETKVLLSHGDRYCTRDKSHQWLRRVTRNRIFTQLFLQLPYSMRIKLVNAVRMHSQTNRNKPMENLQVVANVMIRHMDQYQVDKVIHGHTHQPGIYFHQQGKYTQLVLSDWDDTPQVLCYDNARSFYFDRLGDLNG